MSSGFDPSPRASKRRKTTRYGTERTILSDDNSYTPEKDGDIDGVANGSDSVTPKARASVKGSVKSFKPGQSHATESEPLVNGEERSNAQDPNVTPSKAHKQSAKSNAQFAGSPNGAAPESVQQTVNGQQNGSGEKAGQQETEEREHELAEDEDTPKVRSSGRQRKKPSRFADTTKNTSTAKTTKSVAALSEPAQEPVASPVVKGILTPSRRQKAPRPRKSVMFDQDEAAIGEQLGFKDIGTPGKIATKESTDKRTPRKTVLQAREALIEDVEVEIEAGRQDQEQAVNDMIIDTPQEDVVIPDLTAIEGTFVTSVAEDNDSVRAIKASILSRLTSASLPDGPPSHLESPYNQLHSLLHSTIVSSESNSLLLLGPRGAGKSMLLSLALRSLTDGHSSDFHTVHLNGFFQTDDRLALREIWRQLGREMQVDEMETEDVAASYADTMASLLSLLSHPDEMALDGQNGADDIEDLASNAVHIATGGQRTSKSIVFILDEFDLFTNHPRQTLLYNLFDIAQSRKAPIIVIGCSTRMDVIECLEKRVKSRFSHRWLLVPNCRTFLEWERLVKEALLMNSHERLLSSSNEHAKWIDEWNKHIETSFLPSTPIQYLLKSHFYTTKSLPDLFTSLYPLIATLNPSASPRSTPPPTSTHPSTYTAPTLLTLLTHLPTLHLTLLISTSRLHTIHHLASTNFNLVYTHYTELLTQSRLRQSAAGNLAVSGSLRAWGRETCRGAWEDLGRWGVITPVVGGREEDGESGGDGWETRMWRCEVSLEELGWGVRERERDREQKRAGGGSGSGSGSGVLERWCKEI